MPSALTPALIRQHIRAIQAKLPDADIIGIQRCVTSSVRLSRECCLLKMPARSVPGARVLEQPFKVVMTNPVGGAGKTAR